MNKIRKSFVAVLLTLAALAAMSVSAMASTADVTFTMQQVPGAPDGYVDVAVYMTLGSGVEVGFTEVELIPSAGVTMGTFDGAPGMFGNVTSGGGNFILFEAHATNLAATVTTDGPIVTVRFALGTADSPTIGLVPGDTGYMPGGTGFVLLTAAAEGSPLTITAVDPAEAWLAANFTQEQLDDPALADFLAEVSATPETRAWWVWYTENQAWISFINEVLAWIQAPAPDGWGHPNATFDDAVYVANNVL